jgi:hypothetical protein
MSTGDRRIFSRWRLGDVKLPGKLPTPEKPQNNPKQRTRNRVAIVGQARLFAKAQPAALPRGI